MKRAVAGQPVTLAVALADAEGNELTVSALQHRLLDESGAVLQDWTNLSGPFSSTVSLSYGPSLNQTTELRTIRHIQLQATTPGGVELIEEFYILEAVGGVLQRGQNSAVTMATALLKGYGQRAEALLEASNDARSNALLEAYRRLCRLDYKSFDLSELTQSEFLSLDPTLLNALADAQVAEANAILTPDPIGDRRRMGITLDTIGESKMMFSSAGIADLGLSKEALKYIGRYVSVGSLKIGRA